MAALLTSSLFLMRAVLTIWIVSCLALCLPLSSMSMEFIIHFLGEKLTHLGDGTIEGNISVFLVHVVGTSSGLISNDQTIDLDVSVALFKDL